MNRLITIVVLSFSLLLPGCASWAQRYRDTPVAAFTQDVAYMNLAVGVARAAVASTGDTDAMRQFDQIAGQVQRGLALATDGVRIAANAGSSQPDYGALLRDSKSAMGSLNEFIRGFTTGPGQAANPMMREAALMTARAAQ
jgi:hypothetical protein